MRLLRGSIWAMAGVVISRGLLLVVTIPVARMLGAERFGEFGVVQNTILMFGTFGGLGLGMTATKYVAEFREKDRDKVGRIIALTTLVSWFVGGLMAAVLFLAAPWLADRALSAPALADELQLSAVLLITSAVSGVQTGTLAGFEAFKSIARVNLFTGVIAGALLLLGTHTHGVYGAVGALVAGQVVTCIVNAFIVRKVAFEAGASPQYKGALGEVSMLWQFGLPAVLTNAVVASAYWMCSAILVNQPNGYWAMGVFNVANQWRSLFVFIPSMIGEAVMPVLAERTGNAGIDSTKPILRNLFLANFVIGLPLLLGLCALSPIIMSFYGDELSSNWDAFSLLQLSGFLQLMQIPIIKFWPATGRMWTHFSVNILWAIILVGAAALLVDKQQQGVVGLTLANVLAFAIYSIPLGFLLHSFMKSKGP